MKGNDIRSEAAIWFGEDHLTRAQRCVDYLRLHRFFDADEDIAVTCRIRFATEQAQAMDEARLDRSES